MKQIGITNGDIAAYLRSLTAGEYYGPREKWPAYLTYRPDERLFFNAYTYEQVEAYVKANPARWMANPYAEEDAPVALGRDLERLYATGSGMSYLAYGAEGSGGLRIDGTRYFYRDASELEGEREMFEDLQQTAR
jgi:hypothetical protein